MINRAACLKPVEAGLFVRLSTPGTFLQVTKATTHLLSFMGSYFFSFSFFAAGHFFSSVPFL